MDNFITGFFITIILVLLVMVSVVVHTDNILESKVQSITNNYTELVARQAILDQDMLDDLRYELKKYGNFTVTSELKISLLNGEYDRYYDEADIIGVQLKPGDKIKINVFFDDMSFYRRLRYALPSVISSGSKRKVVDAACTVMGN